MVDRNKFILLSRWKKACLWYYICKWMIKTRTTMSENSTSINKWVCRYPISIRNNSMTSGAMPWKWRSAPITLTKMTKRIVTKIFKIILILPSRVKKRTRALPLKLQLFKLASARCLEFKNQRKVDQKKRKILAHYSKVKPSYSSICLLSLRSLTNRPNPTLISLSRKLLHRRAFNFY